MSGPTADDADEILGPVPVHPGERYQWKSDLSAKPIRFTIFGQPASKANSRKAAFIGKGDNRRMIWIKSEAALKFEQDALRQIPSAARVRFEGPVRITLWIWYRTELPDLDESLVLDVLQDRYSKQSAPGSSGARRLLVQAGVYKNDRQVREKHVFHGIDRTNPRVEILIESLTAQQMPLL